jgi:pullulanase-type alpha-1,6-glucosidase
VAPSVDARLAWGDAGFQTVLNKVPVSSGSGSGVGAATTLTIHYQRPAGDYAGWTLHTYGAAVETLWTAGRTASSTDAFGPVYTVPLASSSGSVGYIFHNGDTKDHGGADQSYTLKPGLNEIWRVQGDNSVYTAPPGTRSVSTTDARAFWLTQQLLQWPRGDPSGRVKLYFSATGQIAAALDGAVTGADGSITLDTYTGTVPAAAATRFKWIDTGPVFSVKDADLARMATLHRNQLVLVQEDANGKVQNATTAQTPGALDALYAGAQAVNDLGVSIVSAGSTASTRFKLWAPTAQKVYVYTYDSATSAASTVDEAVFDTVTGVWSAQRSGDLSGQYYRYAVEVFVRGTGLVLNLVTDPYSISLNTDSQRSYIANLSAANLKPAGWDASAIPDKVTASTDLVVYELHVRDFSANDSSVSAANRGKYGAFTEAGSNGMKHLKALADAGLTDVHLMPVFDFATVPEFACTTPDPAQLASGAPDAETQQAMVTATAATDCYNWGYDPWHYNAPEGSYASDAGDGAKRIVEFRRMVMALHAAGLRVGMDVVYNHTTASGQNAKSVLDRIVPGYYHRLDASGAVTTSSCCDNTAAENGMMGKLVVDSVALWARDYKIASFRFDVMGHLPRAVLEAAQTAANAAAGRRVQLFGEGWNFGEVANGARFPQASQGGLNGTAIGSFGDKLRDAVRGGGCCDSGSGLVRNQGYINGLFYDPNAQAGSRPLNDLRWSGDLIKGALAGSIADYPLLTHWDATVQLKDLGGVGFAAQPAEVVNYVENHDNLTLFDVNAMKLPAATTKEDRARVQLLGVATVALSQGTAYFHAGMDVLRSKSLDRNSYESGDWFNRLDWTAADNNYGVGLPRAPANGADWPILKPFLSGSPAIKPAPGDIAWMRDAFRDLLKVRASTTLLRLKTADDIKSRLAFYNLGSGQVPTVLAARVDGTGYAGANMQELAYFINVGTTAQTLTIPALARKAYVLHPAQATATAADRRVATGARYASTGAFTVPARSVAVFVVP